MSNTSRRATRITPSCLLTALLTASAILLACLWANAAQAGQLYTVGLHQTHATVGEPIPLAIWYPSNKLADQAAAPAVVDEAALAEGKFPLILLSHGSGGWEMGHRDWAEYLAGHGYIVLAPRHWGDSFDRPDGRGSDVQLIGRVLQASAALDTVLADARFRSAIAAGRIGMMGFSAGGYTTLVMAGAKPDFSLWHAHCAQHAAQDDEFCPSVIWRFLPRTTRSDWALPHETRIKAAVAMAPAAVVFDRAGLAGVTIPLRLYGASADRLTQNAWNVSHVAASLPTPHTVRFIPGDHFVFLAPCSSALRARLPQLCIDAKGIDRAAWHLTVARELLAFFDASL